MTDSDHPHIAPMLDAENPDTPFVAVLDGGPVLDAGRGKELQAETVAFDTATRNNAKHGVTLADTDRREAVHVDRRDISELRDHRGDTTTEIALADVLGA